MSIDYGLSTSIINSSINLVSSISLKKIFDYKNIFLIIRCKKILLEGLLWIN